MGSAWRALTLAAGLMLVPGCVRTAPADDAPLPSVARDRMVGVPLLSPDGSTLAYFRAVPGASDLKSSALAFRDLETGTTWAPAPAVRGPAVLKWSPDSRACFAGGQDGAGVAQLETKKWEWIRHSPDRPFSGCAAWGPRSGRLAVFADELSGGEYHLRGGGKAPPPLAWSKRLELPSIHGPWRAWQCEWSPDEKSLLLRFYGHADRDADAAGHLAVLDPETGAPRFRWGAEAGPAQWLDAERLVFRDDDGGQFFQPRPLVVARPRTGERRTLLDGIVTWALAPDRGTIWALTQGGDLHALPTAAGRQRRLKVRAPGGPWSLSVSPAGHRVALWTHPFAEGDPSVHVHAAEGGARVALLGSGSPIQVLGWGKGEDLPLLAVQRSSELDEWEVRPFRLGAHPGRLPSRSRVD